MNTSKYFKKFIWIGTILLIIVVLTQAIILVPLIIAEIFRLINNIGGEYRGVDIT